MNFKMNKSTVILCLIWCWILYPACKTTSEPSSSSVKAIDLQSLWFDRGKDSRPIGETPLRQIDFDFGAAKGQCAMGEYTAGVAYYDEWVWHRHKPHAILCCPFS